MGADAFRFTSGWYGGVAILGFIRVSTHPRVFSNPMRPAEAMRRVKSWLDHPSVRVVTPGEHHGRILFKLLEDLGTAGNLTTDAHLAALAIEYKAELASTDVGFARFDGLRWFNPLAAGARVRASKACLNYGRAGSCSVERDCESRAGCHPAVQRLYGGS